MAGPTDKLLESQGLGDLCDLWGTQSRILVLEHVLSYPPESHQDPPDPGPPIV